MPIICASVVGGPFDARMDDCDIGSRIPPDTDVVLAVENRCFYCNRSRLARSSPYFEAMFNSQMIESQAEIIELKGVCYRSVKALINFVNNGSFPDVSEDVLPLLEAAIMYQFDAVRDRCVEYLQSTVTIANCVEMMHLGDRFGLSALHLQAKQTALWNFSLVVGTREFLDWPRSALIDYLSHEDLNVPSEPMVLQSIAKWIDHDIESRLPSLDEELISVVRFSAINLRDLKTVAHDPLVLSCPWLRRVIHEIWNIKFHQYLEERHLVGVSSRSITPLSSISPAETTEEDSVVQEAGSQDCVSNLPLNKADSVSVNLNAVRIKRDSANGENTSIKAAGCAVVMAAIKVERVVALRLLTAGPRSVPAIPSVILYNKYDRSKLPTLMGYDYDQKSLLELGTMTKAVQDYYVAFGFKAVAVENFVYIVGGEFLIGYGNWNYSVWRFNTFTKMWAFLVRLREPRRHHAVCVLDDYLYLIGGTSRFRVLTDRVEKLQLSTGNWSDASCLPKVIHTAVCTTHQGKIYIVEAGVYCYNPNLDKWCCFEMPCQLRTIVLNAVVSHSTGIYLVGCNSGELIRYVPESSDGDIDEVDEKDKAVSYGEKWFQLVGNFSHPTVNACIVKDKIYAFSNTDFLVVESYSIVDHAFAIEMESDDPKYRGASNAHGCFSLPKYS